VFGGLAHLAAVRGRLPHLHASVPAQMLEPSDPGVLAVLRDHPIGPLLGLYNLTEQFRPWPAARLRALGYGLPVDAVSGTPVSVSADDAAWLAPHAFWWVVEAGSINQDGPGVP
jgi:amylosucrase